MLFLLSVLVYSAESNDTAFKNTLKDQQVSKQEENVFPCELSENPVENVPIFFYGTNHTSQEDARLRDLLMFSGLKGDFYVGLEGYNYSDSINDSELSAEMQFILSSHGLDLDVEKSRLFGLEEELVHLLVMLPKNYVMLHRAINGLFGEERRLSEYKIAFLMGFWGEPLLIDLWRQIKRPLLNSEDEKFAVFIDELILIPESEIELMMDKLMAVQNQQVWQNTDAFLSLSKRIAKDFTLLPIPELRTETLNLDFYNSILENPGNLMNENRFAVEIAVKWRDSFIIKNIARIYCSALTERKPLHLVVGRLHVENLSNLVVQGSSNRIKIVQ